MLINREKLLEVLEREVDLADHWKTAHEMYNVVKYFPTIDIPTNVAIVVGEDGTVRRITGVKI